MDDKHLDTNIQLRPLQLSDAPVLAKLANNKKIWNNLRDYIPYPYYEKDAEVFISATLKEDPNLTFAILDEGKFSGVIGLVAQKDVYRKSAEIGYWVGEPFWGKGVASKAVGLALQYGFETLRLQRIFSGVFEYNLASMKVLEKNGFQKEGILKSAVLKNGKFHNEHRFFKLNEDQI